MDEAMMIINRCMEEGMDQNESEYTVPVSSITCQLPATTVENSKCDLRSRDRELGLGLGLGLGVFGFRDENEMRKENDRPTTDDGAKTQQPERKGKHIERARDAKREIERAAAGGYIGNRKPHLARKF